MSRGVEDLTISEIVEEMDVICNRKTPGSPYNLMDLLNTLRKRAEEYFEFKGLAESRLDDIIELEQEIQVYKDDSNTLDNVSAELEELKEKFLSCTGTERLEEPLEIFFYTRKSNSMVTVRIDPMEDKITVDGTNTGSFMVNY